MTQNNTPEVNRNEADSYESIQRGKAIAQKFVDGRTEGKTSPQTNALGWLYDNEDTGREYSDDHPVESGSVPDATNILPANAENLLAELKSSWKAWNEDRAAIAEMSGENYRYRKEIGRIADMLDDEDAELDDAISIASAALASEGRS